MGSTPSIGTINSEAVTRGLAILRERRIVAAEGYSRLPQAAMRLRGNHNCQVSGSAQHREEHHRRARQRADFAILGWVLVLILLFFCFVWWFYNLAASTRVDGDNEDHPFIRDGTIEKRAAELTNKWR